MSKQGAARHSTRGACCPTPAALTAGCRSRHKSGVSELLRLVAAALLSAAIPCVSFASSKDEPLPPPSWSRADESIPEPGERRTGRQIYETFLDNKFRESYQRLRVISRDPGGSEQLTRFEMSLRDLRDEEKRPVGGVNAKMLVKVTAPFDMRHTSYLIVSKDPGPDDEFAYQPSQRRVKRVDLKNTSLFGTDYTFNAIAFQSIEDADYTRLPDEEIDGTSVYVVEANVKETIDVEYHRTIIYLEKEHHVALRTRYWDQFGVEVKEMTAPHAQIRAFGETWVAAESTMKDLRQRTSSSIYVDDLDTNPQFHKKVFAVSRLAQGH